MTAVATQPEEVNLEDLTDAQVDDIISFCQTHGLTAEFTQTHLDAVVALKAERAKAPTKSGTLTSLAEWSKSKANDAKTVVTGKPAEQEAEPKAPSIKDRPASIAEIIGQEDVVGRLRMVCAGSVIRGKKMPHVLISGPPGFGKTTLANVIAAELGLPLVETTGMVLRKISDLVGLVCKMTEPTVLFIDEVHAMPKATQEAIYTAMEDGKIDDIAGSGSDAMTVTHEVPGLVVVGATTRPGMINPPMRDRFGLKVTMSEYEDDELAEMVGRGWTRESAPFVAGEALEVGKRAKGVPRLALNLAERVLDYAAVQGALEVSEGMAADALAVFGISDSGLDETDFRIIRSLVEKFNGRPVGLAPLAQFLDLDVATLADQYEPFLCRGGYMLRTKGGRMAGPAAYELVKGMQA